MPVSKREKMTPPEDPWIHPNNPKRFVTAFPPFPRSTWIHRHVPIDNFDRICKNIWRRAKQTDDELCRSSHISPELQRNKDYKAPDNKPSHRSASHFLSTAEERQKQTDDMGLNAESKENKQQYHTDFILPCPYLSSRRHPHVAKPACGLRSLMGEEMKRNEEEEVRGERNLQKGVDAELRVENPLKKILAPQSSSRGDKHYPTSNPVLSATDDHSPRLRDDTASPLPSKLSRETCESEDEQSIRSSSDSNSSSDEDPVTLPRVRTRATDSGDDDSGSDNKGRGEEDSESPYSSDESSSDSEQDSPCFSIDKDFPPLSTIKAGILPCPTKPPASGKKHGQWETPLSFRPHDCPTATLASAVTTHAPARRQGKAKAPQADSKTKAPPAALMQHTAYDLLADFPALEPPKNPLALIVLGDGNPKTIHAKGEREPAQRPDHRQGSRASHQSVMENVPHEIISICAGDQKSVLDLQTFGPSGQPSSPAISCEELKANKQPPPRVAGTDGVGVNARSWASAAKAGMKQAAAPQEKARPCAFPQVVTINGAKDGYSAAQSCANKVSPSLHAGSLLVPTRWHGSQPGNPNRFVRPGYPHPHQQFGARACRAKCPPGFRYPRFPFQQARGNLSKHSNA